MTDDMGKSLYIVYRPCCDYVTLARAMSNSLYITVCDISNILDLADLDVILTSDMATSLNITDCFFNFYGYKDN